MKTLYASRLNEIFLDCFFTDEEANGMTKSQIEDEGIIAEGIINTFAFSPARVEKHRDEIITMLGELPDVFHQGSGGGSFLNACMDKHGNHWGEHRNVEQLFALGIAVGRAAYCANREHWDMFPGGLPYVVILNDECATGDNSPLTKNDT